MTLEIHPQMSQMTQIGEKIREIRGNHFTLQSNNPLSCRQLRTTAKRGNPWIPKPVTSQKKNGGKLYGAIKNLTRSPKGTKKRLKVLCLRDFVVKNAKDLSKNNTALFGDM